MKKHKVSRTVTLSGHLVVRKISKDGTEATRIADSQGRSTASDFNTDGSIDYWISGPTPQNESDTLDVCRILIERLNNDGAHLKAPSVRERDEDGIDCVAIDGEEELYFQVTRVANKLLWRTLANSPQVVMDLNIQSAANDLRNAIRSKETLSSGQRAKIILVLNALDTPYHTYPTIVENFQQRYGDEIRELGFKGIWVVGPTAEMTVRLD